MLRAWSVAEGKGVVNCVASQSSEGTCSRGNLAACASTVEKSRQRRQTEGVGEVDCGMSAVL